ncbi:DDE-type integrase/transposase/recombinase [Ruegeria sediminis]|uniref:DDE-type integrase/transposase/recombinase n=1 Tax=Ruegeria sediminis TaxID=2583820 RepID=A0ABY2X398_9RHOB|nr:transposase domain-containing protein [Ruegeria sediminis]TMV09851.1 DDE-type integrase/transposase/recombinase [Ruegeria sediminis]
MSDLQPDRVWWTANEMAEACLPDMPSARQPIDRMIQRLNWRAHPTLARRRKGRGGGWEYHWTLLPSRAQKALLAEARPAEAETPQMGRDEAWEWFEGLNDKARDAARSRLHVLQTVEALERGGMSRDLAAYQAGRMGGVSKRTVWNWFALVEGVRPDDRLPYLAPRHQAAVKRGAKAECSDEFWDYIKADFLRPERPSFSSVHRRAMRVAREQGWSTLPERTMRRRLEAEVSALTITLCRKGADALKSLYPAQTRDRTALHAMEAVNADYHRFDVFVRWPDSNGEGEEIVRPQMVAFQDIYSGRILSWRLDKTPNKVGVSLALGDMIERFGIPEHVLLDNGREFANKFLTGGVPTRFRFKVKDDDIPGILKVLGVEVHWATPYSGQSKPIERAFRDMCDDIARDPRFSGAYTGNRPDAKPENYQSAAVPLERFIEVVEEGIEEHNIRTGRRGQTAQGRSLLETFEASYAVAPIRKATDAQRRLWLMGAEGVKADARTGLVRFMGNEYWDAWMHQLAGEKVVARFDPADLRAGLHLYALDGGYLGHATCKLAAGFFDIDEARTHAAARRKWVNAEKAAAEAHRKFKVAELGDFLDAGRRGEAAPGEMPQAVEARVVRPVFDRKPVAPAEPVRSAEEEAAHAAFVADFETHRAARTPKVEEDDMRTRMKRALELEARIEAGEPVSRDQERWLEGYQTSAEYKAQRDLVAKFGTDMLG